MMGFIGKYKQRFISTLDSIIVTDREGHRKEIDDGIETACKVIEGQSLRGGKVAFIGNGGSAAIAGHMAVDFWRNGEIPSISFNDAPLLTCISNDYGYEHVFEKPIEVFLNKDDVLFAISSSGRSENILKGARAAQKKSCSVITLSGFDSGNPLREMGALNFYVPEGEYGLVEVAHQYICHWMLDAILYDKKQRTKEGSK
jgi:D-sedoheptulose 7-phosphate isomerase